MTKLKQAKQFLLHDLWRFRLSELDKRKSILFRTLRIAVLAVKGFNEDKCMFRASALTFYTLLSIVPVLATAFGVAKGFGFEELLKTKLREGFQADNGALIEHEPQPNGPSPGWEEAEAAPEPETDDGEALSDEEAEAGSPAATTENGQEESILPDGKQGISSEGRQEIVEWLIRFSENLLENTKGGVLAGIGIAFLIWSVIKVLSNIEKAFNDIWGIKTTRSIFRKFSDYLSVVFVGPILFLLASSTTVYVSTTAEALLGKLSFLGVLAEPVDFLLKILPLTIIWFLFAFMYLFLPNTKVRILSAILGGVIGGGLYQIVQVLYVRSQFGIAQANAVYGSFAALPLFLVWLQLSWLIVLFGAEIAFAHQNVDTYEFEQDCEKVTPSFRRLVSLAVVHYCVKLMRQREDPPTAHQISQHFMAPIRLVNQVLFDLVRARILCEVVRDESTETGYQPKVPHEELTLNEVLSRLEHSGIDSIPLADHQVLSSLSEAMDSFAKARSESPQNVPLKDI